jgi:hypothetical protein
VVKRKIRWTKKGKEIKFAAVFESELLKLAEKKISTEIQKKLDKKRQKLNNFH